MACEGTQAPGGGAAGPGEHHQLRQPAAHRHRASARNRLHQILAVLEKHLGLPLSRFDCYLAVAGGLEVEEPAADLGVAAAVVASYRDLTLPPGTVLVGELGLGGQLRPVGQLELRLQEAVRLGFRPGRGAQGQWPGRIGPGCGAAAAGGRHRGGGPGGGPGGEPSSRTSPVERRSPRLRNTRRTLPRPLVFNQFWASM